MGFTLITDKSDFNLSFKAFSDVSRNNFFGIIFTVKLENEEKTFSFEMECIAHFIVVGVLVDQEFLTGSFVNGNAPAIVFPYIRACITNFFQNSGYNPIILPAFNFTSSKKIEK